MCNEVHVARAARSSGRTEDNAPPARPTGVRLAETISGWGFPRYRVSKLGPMAGTLMAIDPGAPKVSRFIALGGEPYLIPYNSRLPIVVYAPEGVEIRYRIWGARPEIKAIEKLDKFTVKIAYPDEWEDYSAMAVNNDNSYFENMMAVNKWEFDKNISEIGQPVDKKEWGMSPQTVNAYFNPLNNEIVFPAAILQPPFYDYRADEAVNYGGIGAVIGHEISHAFDDSGDGYVRSGVR